MKTLALAVLGAVGAVDTALVAHGAAESASMAFTDCASCIPLPPIGRRLAFTHGDGSISEHLSGGLAHDSARHDERCAAGETIDCQVEEGWAFGACSTIHGRA